MFRSVQVICISLLLAILSACASTETVRETKHLSNNSAEDPWEPVNRGVYAFNQGLDRVTLKPAAKGYLTVVPALMRRGVSNFFSNMGTPLTVANQLLQGKGRTALSDIGRLLVNTTLGIGGFFDPASALGLLEHHEDFGQTLARWGVPDGPFIMLPLLGPKTLRDALTLPLDFVAQPLNYYHNSSVRSNLWALEAVEVRVPLLAADALIVDSPDAYIMLREAYRQHRRYRIYDGQPPATDEVFLEGYFEEETPSAEAMGNASLEKYRKNKMGVVSRYPSGVQ